MTSSVVIVRELLDLVEKIAEKVHQNWAAQKLSEGWQFGNRYDLFMRKLFTNFENVHHICRKFTSIYWKFTTYHSLTFLC
jgi:hypothetical protein